MAAKAGNVLEYKAAPKWLTELAQNAIKQAEKPAHASEEERKVMQPMPIEPIIQHEYGCTTDGK